MTNQPRPEPRISPKVRDAIEARVCKGLSIAAAAEEAGLSRTGFAKALQRPAVADLLSQTQARFVAEVNSKRALHRARALDVAMEMLNSDKTDDRVKVKLIEILSQDGKAPAFSVHVDASTNHHGGYEFVPPNARVVEIKSEDAEPDTGVPHLT